jgi:hypothetical protein
MVSSGKLRRVALVRTKVSDEPSVSFITVTRTGEVATDARCEEIPRATRRNIPEENILHSHRRENLKFYTVK